MSARVWLVAALACSISCGGSTTTGPAQPPTVSESPELQALFASLPAPVVVGDAAPRLVLREGPAVPEAHAAPLPIAIKRDAAPAPTSGAAAPLKVLSYAPTGKDDLTGAVRITFDQPMVAVAQLRELSVSAAPFEITPAVPGRVRWLGTHTLAFEPTAGRLPLGTDYQVKVAAGTRSVLGGVLARELTFPIKTPVPLLVETVPQDGAEGIVREPWLVLRFNQRVDANAVAQKLRVEGPGASALHWSVVSADEIAQKLAQHPEVGGTPDARSVVLKADAALSPGANYRVVLPAGFVGAEGPKPTTDAQGFSFRTLDPLRVVALRCGWDRCVPGAPVYLEFNNPIATSVAELKPLLKVQPAPGDVEPLIQGNTIQLEGFFAAKTSYRVQLGAGVRDIHDQVLARAFSGTINVGDALPELSVELQRISTLERKGTREIGMRAVNVNQIKARTAKVERDAVFRTLAALDQFRPWDSNSSDPFAVAQLAVKSQTLTPRGPRNQQATVLAPIDAVVPAAAAGYALVEIEARQDQMHTRAISLVQVTDLNAIVLTNPQGLLVRVLSLSSAQPVANAKVELINGNGGGSNPTVAASAVSDAQGVARLSAPHDSQWIVRITHEDDQALVATWIAGQQPEMVGSIITDRDPYRPGDTVHFKLLARERELTAQGNVRVPRAGTSVSCTSRDAQYQERDTLHGTLSAYGGFAGDIVVPVGAALGHWQLVCTVGDHGAQIGGTFQVQEYRAPEIEVAVSAPEGVFFHGDSAPFTVHSKYLFGASAAGLAVDYTVSATPEHFAPPGHDDFRFGDKPDFPMPWLRGPGFAGGMAMEMSGRGGVGGARMRMPYPMPNVAAVQSSGHVVLDAQGNVVLPIAMPRGEEEGPLRFNVEAAVTDLSRQQVANRASVIAHPSAVYVGVKPSRMFSSSDEPIVASLIAVDVEGRITAGRKIETRLLRAIGAPQWHPLRGLTYDVEEKEVGKCVETSAAEPSRCQFAPQQPGRYTLESTTTDAANRKAKTRVTLWIHGSGIRPWFSNEANIEISPDKESYAVGETAKLLVRAPIATGRGVLTLERRGIVESRMIELDGSIQLIEVPITADHVPNLTVRLSIARGRLSEQDTNTLLQGLGAEARRAAAEDIGRPMHVAGSVELQVKRDSKRFTVTITPDQATHQPGDEMGATVEVKEPNGVGADADVTIIAVDEAVLSLLGYVTPDPLPLLVPPVYAQTGLEAVANSLLRRVQPQSASSTASEVKAEGAMMMERSARASGGAPPPMAMAPEASNAAVADSAQSSAAGPATARTLFATTAYYLASARTDAGKVNVRFKLPDNLTRFRLMAIAVGRTDHAGSGEGHVTVRKPLLLRPALPRVASFGDRFEAAVIVHNETGAARDITVGIRAAGLSVQGEPIVRQRLEAGEAREVAFAVIADHVGGAARVQFAAATEGGNDAVEITVPLIEPATSEAFATYGSLNEGAVRYPVSVPSDAIGRFGGLELSMSSTALTDLSDGADYLLDYPYECAEQLASRLIGASSLATALKGRDDERAQTMRRVAEASIEKLQALRHGDGGFGLWPGDVRDGAYRVSTSAWVLLALHEARAAEISVPNRMFDGAAEFVAQRLQYSQHMRDWSLWDQALAAYVLSEVGRAPAPDVIERLWQKRNALPLFARAWLASTVKRSHPRRVEELVRQIHNAGVETAAGAHFAEHETDGAHFLWHSEHRTDAIVLRVLQSIAADDPLIEKTVRGLVASRRNGRWQTTQENAWALSALTRYYRVAERDVPDMTARAWLGAAQLSEVELRGRQTSVLSSTLPMATLQEVGSGDLTIGKEGAGRLYYRVGLRYAPTSLLQDAEEQGFAVTRTFEAVGNDSDVRRDTDGTWHMKAGATVRVRLTVVVPDTRYDVALDDPLPAGLEPLNLGFATTASQALGEAAQDQSGPEPMWGYRCWMPWVFEHRELRDDRVTAFSGYVGAGVYELVYLTRATTPGRFLAAPTKIEEMYAPETFARSGSDVVVVER